MRSGAPFDIYLSARDRAIDQMKKGQDAAENQDSGAYGAAQAAVTKSAPQRKKLAGVARLQGLQLERRSRLSLG